MSEPYPWQRALWQRLALSWNRLPQGLLLSGPRGVGKREFAMHYGNAMVCESPGSDRHPCDHCRSCQLFRSGSHPDILVLMPEADMPGDFALLGAYGTRLRPDSREKPKMIIGVDQVRNLIRALATTSHTAGRSIALIAPAEAMNANAANALLKLLEEPTGDSVLLLVSEDPYRLPATVRSRCVELNFALPDADAARLWVAGQSGVGSDADRLLRLARGAPLRAARMAAGDESDACEQCLQDVRRLLAGEGNPIRVAARWRTAGAERNLVWLHDIVADLVRIAGGADPDRLASPSGRASLHDMVKNITVPQLFSIYDKVTDVRRLIDSTVDPTLLLEDLLVSIGQVGIAPR